MLQLSKDAAVISEKARNRAKSNWELHELMFKLRPDYLNKSLTEESFGGYLEENDIIAFTFVRHPFER